jgi:archaellum biogenesis protein FlaJ (TadC family)
MRTMNHTLVILCIFYLAVLLVLLKIKVSAHEMNRVQSGEKLQTTTSQRSTYYKFVLITLAASVLVGYVAAPKDTTSLLIFTGANVSMALIAGWGLFLRQPVGKGK